MKTFNQFVENYDSNRTGFRKAKREDDEYHNGPDPVKHTYKYKVSKDGGEQHERAVTTPLTRAPKHELEHMARKHLEKQGYKIHEEIAICSECGEAPCNCDNSHGFVAEGSEQEKPIKKSHWFDPTDMRSPEKQKAAYLNHLAAKKKNKNIKEQGVAEANLSELNKDTIYSYAKKSEADLNKKHKELASQIRANKPVEANKTSAKLSNRDKGLDRAETRLNKEESINELSSDTLQSYKEKAKKSADELTAKGEHGKSLNRTMSRMKATGKQIEKTNASIKKALNKEESFKPMDEPRYDLSIAARQKRADDAAKAKKEKPTASIKKALNKEEASSADDHIKAFASQAHEEWRKGFDPSGSGKERIKKNSDGTHGNINVPFHKLHPDWQHENLAAGAAAHHAVTHHGDNMEAAADHVHKEWMKRNPKAEWNADQHKPYAELPEHEKEKDRVHVRTMAAIMNKKINESINVEQYDKGEYDYEGQMARTQLQTTMRNCRDMIEMIKDDDNLPEWVQSKITLAQDYITTVRDYMQSKEELGEETLFESKHKVAVTVSEKDHPMVSKRLEKQQKRVVVSANSKDEAVSRAKKFYTKQGYHVHDAEYHSSMSEGVKSPGIGWMIKKDPHLKAVIAKHKEKMKNFKAYVGSKIEPKDKK